MTIQYKIDGLCYIHLRSDLTVSTLSPEAAALINAVHAQIPDPKPAFQSKVDYGIEDTNPYVLLLNDLDMGGAPWTRAYGTDHAWCGPIINRESLKIDRVILITMFGGEVEGYKLWIEVDDLDADIPGETRLKGMKWKDLTGSFPVESEWHKGENGKYYRGTEIHQTPNDGQPLHAREWVALLMAGVSFVDQATKDEQFPQAPR